MDKLIIGVSKKAKLIAIILLFAATGFLLIATLANLGGGFMPVLGDLILLLVDLVIVGIIPLLLVLNKDSMAKYVLAPIFGYWMLRSIHTYIGHSSRIVGDNPGLIIAPSVFEFIIGCALLAILVLMVLYFFMKKPLLLNIGFAILACSLVFFLLTFVLWIAAYAKYNSDWPNYFYAFYEFLFLPAGLTFAVMDFLVGYIHKDVGNESVESQDEENADADANETPDVA